MCDKGRRDSPGTNQRQFPICVYYGSLHFKFTYIYVSVFSVLDCELIGIVFA